MRSNQRLRSSEDPQRRTHRRIGLAENLKISPGGKLLYVFEITAGDGTTNVAFSEGEKELYVTVVKDRQAKGGIVKIANVK